MNIDCPIYGMLHFVTYKDMQFYLGESQMSTAPPLIALHYLLPPNLLVIPEFELLEDTKPESL